MASRYAIAAEFTLVDKASKALAKMGAAGEALGGMLTKSYRAAEERVNAFGRSVAKVGKMAATAGAVALTAGVVSATKKYIEFDNEIRKSGAMFKDLDVGAADYEARLESLGAVARQVAAITEFSATETSQALSSFAMAGYTTEQATSLLVPATDLATAAQISLAEAADIATASIGAFKGAAYFDSVSGQFKTIDADAESLTRISDIFAATATSTRTSVQTIFAAVQNAGVSFTSAGQSVETLVSAIGLLGNAGIDAQVAGTQLNAVFTQLANGKKRDVLKGLGVDVVDSMGNFRDFGDILTDLQTHLGGMGNAERLGVLSQVFDARGAKAMNVLLQTGADEFNKYRDSVMQANGAASRMAGTMRMSLANQIEVLKSGLVELGFKFVSAFRDKGSDALQKIIDFVQNLDTAPLINTVEKVLSVLGSVIKTAWSLRKIILGVAVAVFTFKRVMDMIVIVNKVSSGLRMLSGIFTSLWPAIIGGFATLNSLIAATPVGWVIAAIAGLIILIMLLVENWDSVTEAMGEFWEGAKEVFNRFMEYAKAVWDHLKEGFVKIWDSVRAKLEPSLNKLKESFGVLWESVKKLFGAIGDVAGKIFGQDFRFWDLFLVLLEKIADALALITTLTAEVMNAGVGGIGGFISDFATGITNVLTAFTDGSWLDGLKAIGGALLSLVLAPIQLVLDLLGCLPDWLGGSYFKAAADNFREWRNGLSRIESKESRAIRARGAGGFVRDNLSKGELAQPLKARGPAPTQTETMASSYSYEETENNSLVVIELDEGLKQKEASGAPVVVMKRPRSGNF